MVRVSVEIELNTRPLSLAGNPSASRTSASAQGGVGFAASLFTLHPSLFHPSPFTFHLSRFTSHVSPLTSHLSRLTSHLSPLTASRTISRSSNGNLAVPIT